MITGDAEDTAIAVASAVGFYDPLHHRTLSGAEIEGMSGRRLEVSVIETVQPVRLFRQPSSQQGDFVFIYARQNKKTPNSYQGHYTPFFG